MTTVTLHELTLAREYLARLEPLMYLRGTTAYSLAMEATRWHVMRTGRHLRDKVRPAAIIRAAEALGFSVERSGDVAWVNARFRPFAFKD